MSSYSYYTGFFKNDPYQLSFLTDFNGIIFIFNFSHNDSIFIYKSDHFLIH